jgi:hypothetical protein
MNSAAQVLSTEDTGKSRFAAPGAVFLAVTGRLYACQYVLIPGAALDASRRVGMTITLYSPEAACLGA